MFDVDEIIRLVERVKSQDVDDSIKSRMDGIAAQAADAQAASLVSENYVFGPFAESLRNQIALAEAKLLTERRLDPVEREALIEKVAMFRSFLSMFDKESLARRFDDLKEQASRLAEHVDASLKYE